MKKDKHWQHCHYQQKYCFLVVLSVYVMLGKEAQVVLASLILLIPQKWENPFIMLNVGFTAGLQNILRSFTPRCSAELQF